MSDRVPDGDTALQHHLEDELQVRRILGDGTELRLYGAGFVAGWDAAVQYLGARILSPLDQDEREDGGDA